jgi:hypothetical protein
VRSAAGGYLRRAIHRAHVDAIQKQVCIALRRGPTMPKISDPRAEAPYNPISMVVVLFLVSFSDQRCIPVRERDGQGGRGPTAFIPQSRGYPAGSDDHTADYATSPCAMHEICSWGGWSCPRGPTCKRPRIPCTGVMAG